MTGKNYHWHLYEYIFVPEERDRQRTINNICLAFLGSDSKQGNICDVSAFLLHFSNRNEDIKVGVFCALHFSDLNFSDNNKTNSVITLPSFAYWFAHCLSLSLPHTQMYTNLDRCSSECAYTLVACRHAGRGLLYISYVCFRDIKCHII